MSKSDIYVPSCHIYVQITLYISKVQYICPKLRCVYPNPATCFRFLYNSQMILHISIQFRYKYFMGFSWTFLDYFMRSVFHVSLHDLSQGQSTFTVPVGGKTSRNLKPASQLFIHILKTTTSINGCLSVALINLYICG